MMRLAFFRWGASLLQNYSWLWAQAQLIFDTALVWVGMLAFFASIIIARLIDPSAGSNSPRIYQGWPNRFLVFTYVLWLTIVAGDALWLI
jgi:hypothetical protein